MTALSTLDPTQQTITRRAYQFETDFAPIRDLLIQTYPITPTGWNWDIRWWEGNHWHRTDEEFAAFKWSEFAVWETEDGTIIGVVNSEYGKGDLYIQLHPDYRHLEDEMIAWGEEVIAQPAQDSTQRQIGMMVKDYDLYRQHVLAARGWQQTENWYISRRQRFGNRPIPPVELAEGYTLYTPDPNDAAACQKFADLLNAAFNRTFHSAPEVHNFMTKQPSLFDPDLHLFAVAPDGSFAAHVGITYEPTYRYGIFEPVCTHPDHQRRGLARALINEGLRRLRTRGACDAYVDTGEMGPANGLYSALGFLEVYKAHWWRKTW